MRNAPPAKSSRQQKKKSGGGMLLGIFVGLVIGVLIAFGVVWYLNKTPLPFQDKTGRAEKPPEAPRQANGQPAQPEPLPGKPGDKVGDKPRFDFYKILPGNQEATPAPAVPAAAPEAPAAAAPGDSFYLQAGAFQKAADADNLKAKLALMGVDVDVQQATTPDKGTVYRVRVGPYATPADMNRARNQLAQNGIQSTVVKIKDNSKN
jgi:cell division protein FtsN